MPAKITYAIPSRKFEIVRDRIGAILMVELTEQSTTYANPNAACTIWLERKITLPFSSLPVVVVSVATDTFGNKSAGSIDGTCVYNIDILTNAPANDANDGDTIANVKAQALAGLCQAILDDAIYNTLDFPPGFIGTTSSQDINIAQYTPEDARNNAHARLTLSVRMTEDTELPPAPTIVEDVYADVRVEQSAYGFQYVITTP